MEIKKKSSSPVGGLQARILSVSVVEVPKVSPQVDSPMNFGTALHSSDLLLT